MILEKIVLCIQELAKEKNMSMYRLAQNAGISQSTLSNIIHRQNSPEIRTLERISNGLGLTMAEFFSYIELRYDDRIAPDTSLIVEHRRIDMQVRDLADAFGWTICDLAEVMGYSPPGLYNIFKGHNIDQRRLKAALHHLKLISQMMYEQEQEKSASKALANQHQRDGQINKVIEMRCFNGEVSDVQWGSGNAYKI